MGKSAPTVNSSALDASTASTTAAQDSYNLGEDQLKWAQTQWDQEQPIVQEATNAQVAEQTAATNFSNEQQQLYTSTFAPLDQQYATQALNYANPGQLAVNAGAAQANVADSMSAQKNAAATQLEGYGVNPSSGQYAGLTYGYNAATGAAEAGAGTTALQNTKLQGLQLEGQAASLGSAIPGSSAALTNSATGAGTAATSGTATDLTAGSSAMSNSTAFTNAGTGALNATSTAVNGYNTAQEQGYQASQTGAAGIGSAIGGIFGSLMPATGIMGLAQGGPALPTSAIPSGGTPGGSVPPQASPTQGIATDDVPARLTVGEFVVPKDVAAWVGQKALVSQIDKARQEQQQFSRRKDIGGQPSQAIATQPTFQSRPQPQQTQPQQAIPMQAA